MQNYIKKFSKHIWEVLAMTKPITSVLAMILYEEKKFNLDDPITKWFPQFRNMKVLKNKSGEYEDANRVITILDLLTHRAGFTYSGFQQGKLKDDYNEVLGGDIDTERTNEQWLNGLASLPLVSQPGELFSYGKATDLLGILISTIEGKKLGKVMEEKIFNPLGMTDTFFDVPNNKRNRCASNIGYDDSGNLVNLETVPSKMAFKERPSDLEFEAGSGGLWSTIGDYLKFAKLFVENGSSDGIQILKPETIHFMCSNQLTDYQREHSTLMGSAMFREYYGFGLGARRGIERKQWIHALCGLHRLGWLAGCIWWLVVSRPGQKNGFHISDAQYDRTKTTCTGYWI